MSNIDEVAAMPPPIIPASHHRTTSSVAQSPQADTFKRMSMEVATTSSAASTRPTSMNTVFTEEPSEMSSPGSRRSLSFEPANAFLTAVAAQERRVLELREELHKAEGELARLKSHWAQQEATKKRQEIRTHTEVMRPLISPIRTAMPTDRHPHRTSLSLEDEQKKAMYARPRIPERRVFTGRHTRTLSLLSPGTLASRDSLADEDTRDAIPQTPFADTGADGARVSNPRNTGRPHADSQGTKEDLVNTGRQFVGDLRDGLWSFWDDLRQATVGDEALQEPPQRRPSQVRSVARPGVPSRNGSVNASLQSKGGRRVSRSPHARSNTIAVVPSTPARRQSLKGNGLGIKTGDDSLLSNTEDGGWSNWGSPAVKTGINAADDVEAPSSGMNTPRSSVGSNDGEANDKLRKGKSTRAEKAGPSSEEMGLQTPSRDDKGAIPWPSLQKFSPGNLHRTASHLMKEWERSLTPPAEEHEKDWIDRYIDGPVKRKVARVPAQNRPE